jgi:hypothetical protein
VHIAASPDDVEKLKTTLSVSEKEGTFDLVVHGTVEHVEALRDTHAWREGRVGEMRREHGEWFFRFPGLSRSPPGGREWKGLERFKGRWG